MVLFYPLFSPCTLIFPRESLLGAFHALLPGKPPFLWKKNSKSQADGAPTVYDVRDSCDLFVDENRFWSLANGPDIRFPLDSIRI